LVIPEEVLAKPGPHSSTEILLLVRYAEEGANMIGMLGADADTVDFVRFQNAPAEMEGVPLGARILGVADTLVTMTTNRFNRSVRTWSEALLEMNAERGKQFDPRVCDAAIAIFHDIDEVKDAACCNC